VAEEAEEAHAVVAEEEDKLHLCFPLYKILKDTVFPCPFLRDVGDAVPYNLKENTALL